MWGHRSTNLLHNDNSIYETSTKLRITSFSVFTLLASKTMQGIRLNYANTEINATKVGDMIPIIKLVTFWGSDSASNVSSISKIGIQIEPLIQAFKT